MKARPYFFSIYALGAFLAPVRSVFSAKSRGANCCAGANKCSDSAGAVASPEVPALRRKSQNIAILAHRPAVSKKSRQELYLLLKLATFLRSRGISPTSRPSLRLPARRWDPKRLAMNSLMYRWSMNTRGWAWDLRARPHTLHLASERARRYFGPPTGPGIFRKLEPQPRGVGQSIQGVDKNF